MAILFRFKFRKMQPYFSDICCYVPPPADGTSSDGATARAPISGIGRQPLSRRRRGSSDSEPTSRHSAPPGRPPPPPPPLPSDCVCKQRRSYILSKLCYISNADVIQYCATMCHDYGHLSYLYLAHACTITTVLHFANYCSVLHSTIMFLDCTRLHCIAFL